MALVFYTLQTYSAMQEVMIECTSTVACSSISCRLFLSHFSCYYRSLMWFLGLLRNMVFLLCYFYVMQTILLLLFGWSREVGRAWRRDLDAVKFFLSLMRNNICALKLKVINQIYPN